MESVTVNAGSVPSEEQATAALEAAAVNAPSTTEEALSAKEAASSAVKLPEKFNGSTEALLKAYQELERKLGVTKTEETEEDLGDDGVTEETDVVDDDGTGDDLPEVITEDDVEEATEEEAAEEEAEDDEAPLSSTEVVDYLTGRFSDQDGQLTEEDYGLAEEMGYDRNMVDAYIRGQQAAQELADIRINEAAGGADNLEAMLIWAATGLTADEITSYNAAMANNDVTQATLGVAKLRERYEAYNGREPSKLLGGRPARAEASTFASWADVTTAMSDKRYGKDQAYTAQVAAKIGRSAL